MVAPKQKLTVKKSQLLIEFPIIGVSELRTGESRKTIFLCIHFVAPCTLLPGATVPLAPTRYATATEKSSLSFGTLPDSSAPKITILNPLSPELIPICYFLALLAHHF
jgi:hypothetical protein